MIDRETSDKLQEVILCFVKRYCNEKITILHIDVNPKVDSVEMKIVQEDKVLKVF